MAKSSKVVRGIATNKQMKEQRRAASAARQRNQRLLWIGAALALALVMGVIVWTNVRNQQPVAGEDKLASQGNMHIDQGTVSPITYNSTPPTSGPHYPNLVTWGIYDTPLPYEHLVHNLEDGGVVVYYQCREPSGRGCPEMVAELRAVVQPYLDADRNVVMVPNDPTWTDGGSVPRHKDMGAPIALTAWQRLLKLDTVDVAKINAFIERYEGLDHHSPLGEG